ncbi:MAG: hypothetical protein ACE5GK_01665 [Nitrospiria bacterium]
MDLKSLEILEGRVHDMIDMIKTLKQEKHALEIQLDEQEKASRELLQERSEARQRVEKILGTLNRLNDGSNNIEMEQKTEQAPSY